MKKILFSLLSGGVDSTLATLKAIQMESGKRVSSVVPVFVDCGQKARGQEWNAVLQVSERLKGEANARGIRFDSPVRIKLASHPRNGLKIFEWSKSILIKGGKSDVVEVENRNMVLISMVASYAKSLTPHNEKAIIVTGFRNEFYDTRRKFVKQMNRVFKSLEMRIIVDAPVVEYKGVVGKKKLIDEFKSKGYGDLIDMTWSCYTPENDCPCGECPACKKRDKATK